MNRPASPDVPAPVRPMTDDEATDWTRVFMSLVHGVPAEHVGERLDEALDVLDAADPAVIARNGTPENVFVTYLTMGIRQGTMEDVRRALSPAQRRRIAEILRRLAVRGDEYFFWLDLEQIAEAWER